MPNNTRTQVASTPDEAGATMPHRDGVCVGGRACGPWNTGRPGDVRLRKPMSPEDRSALMNLCRIGKLIRLGDAKGYGTESESLATNDTAARLKARGFAVSSFDQQTMYPSDKGKRLFLEMKNAEG